MLPSSVFAALLDYVFRYNNRKSNGIIIMQKSVKITQKYEYGHSDPFRVSQRVRHIP